MTRLDEIEAKADKAVGRMDDEIALLIRAVRQLYFACEEIKYAGGRWAGLIDPDVLELFEE